MLGKLHGNDFLYPQHQRPESLPLFFSDVSFQTSCLDAVLGSHALFWVAEMLPHALPDTKGIS